MKSSKQPVVTDNFHKKWRSAKQVVFEVLNESPEAREDDRVLIQHVMTKYLLADNYSPMFLSTAKFLRLYTNPEKFPSFASILRHRRNWQSKNPDLQGDNYEARKSSQHTQKALMSKNDLK